MNNSLRIENKYPCLRKYLGYKTLVRLSADFPPSALGEIELVLCEYALYRTQAQEFVDSLFNDVY